MPLAAWQLVRIAQRRVALTTCRQGAAGTRGLDANWQGGQVLPLVASQHRQVVGATRKPPQTVQRIGSPAVVRDMGVTVKSLGS